LSHIDSSSAFGIFSYLSIGEFENQDFQDELPSYKENALWTNKVTTNVVWVPEKFGYLRLVPIWVLKT
jgi:hypothetical protein